jgi:hypothetical protein
MKLGPTLELSVRVKEQPERSQEWWKRTGIEESLSSLVGKVRWQAGEGEL